MSDGCPPRVAAVAVAPILEARSLEVRAHGKPLVRDVSFAVSPGQVFGIIGSVGEEVCDLIGSGRKAGEVESEATDEFARWLEMGK